MKAIHLTPTSEGYEIVTLLANRINKKNHLVAIQREGDSDYLMSGGFIITDTPEIRKVLDAIPKDKQYSFVKEFKMDPFAKMYLEEE